MSQKINYAYIKNFKGIKEIEAKDLTRFVAIFGHNGAGKTSFLEAITNAIKAQKGVNGKVRQGEEEGLIEVHFDDFKIKRVVGSKGKLEVEHNGQLVSRPQEWLDEIFQGAIGDPKKFLDMNSKDKVRFILDTFGKTEDYEAIESKRLIKHAQRAEIHRKTLSKEQEVKDYDTDQLVEIEESEHVDIDSLQKELSEKEDHNRQLDVLKQSHRTAQESLDEAKTKEKRNHDAFIECDIEIDLLMKKIEEKRKEKEELISKQGDIKVEINNATNLVKQLGEQVDQYQLKDTDEVRKKISEYGEIQRRIAQIQAKKEAYEETQKKAIEYREEWRAVNDEVIQLEAKQNDLIHELETGYNIKVEEGVMCVESGEHWIPLDELNTAMQLDLAINICLAGPNKIKILTIENANAFDPTTLEKIKEKIEGVGAQCFMETVYPTGYESITITDGIIE